MKSSSLSLASTVLGILLLTQGANGLAQGTDAFEQNQRLGRGVNVLGYDPIWKDRSRGRFQAEHFRLIHEAGFNHVRINLHPFRDCGRTITDTYLQTLDWAVEQALANKLMVILDFVTREAERRGWSWAYWQFDSDFILYDIPGKHWVEPVRDALIPPATSGQGATK